LVPSFFGKNYASEEAKNSILAAKDKGMRVIQNLQNLRDNADQIDCEIKSPY